MNLPKSQPLIHLIVTQLFPINPSHTRAPVLLLTPQKNVHHLFQVITQALRK
ncbi:hypothetical protein LguiA_027820 [Lonicera macranthoides]